MTSEPSVVKPVKTAVALVVRGEADQFLAIRRSEDDASLPGVWGLPAVSVQEGESLEEAAQRVGRQKLGVEVRLLNRVGTGRIERASYVLELTDFEVEVASGTPQVPQPDKSVSQYVDQKFTEDLSLLVPAARGGSVCSRVLLEANGVDWREIDDRSLGRK
jgi:8-oxo-dGTP diphosphatase